MPDIVVVGLQEVIKSTVRAMLKNFFAGNAEELTQEWIKVIVRALNHVNQFRSIFDKNEQYAYYQGQNMAGNFIGLFAKRSVLSRIKELYTCQIKAGLGPKNKGSCALRFRVDETTFAFFNCHLASGHGEVYRRTEMVRTIIKSAFAKAKSLPGAMHHNCLFLFGDLNFRVNIGNGAAREAIREKKIAHLLQFEELLQLRHAYEQHLAGVNDHLTAEVREAIMQDEIISEFKEGEITFPPTYKYDVGTHTYDTSRKQRVPSWTDRILYMDDSNKVE